jgi:hypothetical protein
MFGLVGLHQRGQNVEPVALRSAALGRHQRSDRSKRCFVIPSSPDWSDVHFDARFNRLCVDPIVLSVRTDDERGRADLPRHRFADVPYRICQSSVASSFIKFRLAFHVSRNSASSCLKTAS